MVVYVHWPLGQLPTDGTRAVKPDRGSSNGYTHLMFKGSHKLGKNWAQRVMLEGMTDKSVKQLRTLAASWLEPATVKKVKGADSAGYDQAQRAYVFTLDESVISFTLTGSEKSPIENPCFVIKNWGSGQEAKLKVNGDSQSIGISFRQGVITDTDGTQTMVVYVKYSADSPTSFEITP